MKKIWYIITALIISALLINVISADTQTYYTNTVSDPIYLYNRLNNTYKAYIWAENTDVRIVFFKYTDYIVPYACSTSNTNHFYTAYKNYVPTANSDGSQKNLSQSYTVNGVTYYMNSGSDRQITPDPTAYEWNTTITTITINSSSPSSWTNTLKENIIYYTYGEGAVGPQPQINYGTIPIEYSQNLFTETPQNNLDIIRWYGTQDNNGNDLSNINLEIQAVAGYFQGSSYADLKTSTFSDWQASTHPAVQMFYGNYVNYHSQEYRWGEVATEFRNINTLGTWFWNIFASENTWYQYGWRYRYRLCDENDEPLTEWEFIYTGNSYTPSATEILTTPEEPLTPDTVDTINDINNENNTVNNWYINNTIINNNEYNQTYQQNIIQNIYNVLTGTPDPEKHQKANDVQQTIDNAINTEDNYLNDLSSQLTDLDLPDISQQTGLLKALRWVREVHKETIEETLLAPIILVILTIGLITYLIGRRNG